MQIGKAARSNGSHIKSRLKMEPHGVFKEVTKQCTNKDHYQSTKFGNLHQAGTNCVRPGTHSGPADSSAPYSRSKMAASAPGRTS